MDELSALHWWGCVSEGAGRGPRTQQEAGGGARAGRPIQSFVISEAPAADIARLPSLVRSLAYHFHECH